MEYEFKSIFARKTQQQEMDQKPSELDLLRYVNNQWLHLKLPIASRIVGY